MSEENVRSLNNPNVKGVPAQLECLEIHEEFASTGEVDILVVVSIMKPVGDAEGQIKYSWVAQDGVAHKRAIVRTHLRKISKLISNGDDE